MANATKEMTVLELEGIFASIKKSVKNKFLKGIAHGEEITKVEKNWKGTKKELRKIAKEHFGESLYYLSSWKKISLWWGGLPISTQEYLKKENIHFWSTSSLLEVAKKMPKDISLLKEIFSGGPKKTSLVKKLLGIFSQKEKPFTDWLKIKQKNDLSDNQLSLLKKEALTVALEKGFQKPSLSHIRLALNKFKNNKNENADVLLKRLVSKYLLEDNNEREKSDKIFIEDLKEIDDIMKKDSYLFSSDKSNGHLSKTPKEESGCIKNEANEALLVENEKLKKENSEMKIIISSLEKSLNSLKQIDENDVIKQLKKQIKQLQSEVAKKEEELKLCKQKNKENKTLINKKLKAQKEKSEKKMETAINNAEKKLKESVGLVNSLKEENCLLHQALRNSRKPMYQGKSAGINSLISEDINNQTKENNKNTLKSLEALNNNAIPNDFQEKSLNVFDFDADDIFNEVLSEDLDSSDDKDYLSVFVSQLC